MVKMSILNGNLETGKKIKTTNEFNIVTSPGKNGNIFCYYFEGFPQTCNVYCLLDLRK